MNCAVVGVRYPLFVIAASSCVYILSGKSRIEVTFLSRTNFRYRSNCIVTPPPPQRAHPSYLEVGDRNGPPGPLSRRLTLIFSFGSSAFWLSRTLFVPHPASRIPHPASRISHLASRISYAMFEGCWPRPLFQSAGGDPIISFNMRGLGCMQNMRGTPRILYAGFAWRSVKDSIHLNFQSMDSRKMTYIAC